MKILRIMAVVALVASGSAFAEQAFEPASAGGGVVPPVANAPLWDAPRAILFDNGPLLTHSGTGVGGADESWLQTAAGMGTYGFGHQVAFDNRISDQFTIPAGETWDLTQITFFAYQTGAPTTSTITAVNLQIWDAMPPGGTVVWGDTSTNIMANTAWTNIYRVLDTDTGVASNRAIMANTVAVPLTLGEGTYWLDWQSDGSLTSGPWAPPVTIMGSTTTGDALQSTDGGLTYPAVVDGGTLTGQGFPFVVEGDVQGGGGGGGGGTGGAGEPIPTMSKTGMVVLILALIGISAVLIRRRM